MLPTAPHPNEGSQKLPPTLPASEAGVPQVPNWLRRQVPRPTATMDRPQHGTGVHQQARGSLSPLISLICLEGSVFFLPLRFNPQVLCSRPPATSLSPSSPTTTCKKDDKDKIPRETHTYAQPRGPRSEASSVVQAYVTGASPRLFSAQSCG